MALATIEQVAGVLNLSPRRVQQLVKEEGMPRISRGAYDLVKCVHWYIASLTRRVEEARRGSTETESQARARYMGATADLKQMDVLERKGEVVRIQDVIAVIEPVLHSMRTILLSIPLRVAALVSPSDVNERTHIENMVDAYIRNILEALSSLPITIEAIDAEKRKKWKGVTIGPLPESAPKDIGEKVGNLKVE